MNYEKKARAGFTLIELLIVIAIIGVLASIVVVSLTGNTDNANESVAKSNMSTVNRLFAKLQYDSEGIKKTFCHGTTSAESVGVRDIVTVGLGADGTGTADINTANTINAYLKSGVTAAGVLNTSTAGCLSMEDKWVAWITMGGVTYCIDNASNIAETLTLDATKTFGGLTSVSCSDIS